MLLQLSFILAITSNTCLFFVNGIANGLGYGEERAAPWKVGLFHVNLANQKPEYFCTGNIIGNHWILTAAHCIHILWGVNEQPADGDNMNHNITIAYGSNKMPFIDENNEDPKYPGELYTVEAVFGRTIFVHEKYNWKAPCMSSDDDLALIFLPTPITFNGNVAAAYLDWSGYLASRGTKFPIRVSGWGQTALRLHGAIPQAKGVGSNSKYILYADIDGYVGQVSDQYFKCTEHELKQFVMQFVVDGIVQIRASLSNRDSTRFCGHDDQIGNYNKGTANGDSGGSIDLRLTHEEVLDLERHEAATNIYSAEPESNSKFRISRFPHPNHYPYLVIGIVSKGFGCGDPRFPNVYQSLNQQYLDWIYRITRANILDEVTANPDIKSPLPIFERRENRQIYQDAPPKKGCVCEIL